MKALFHYNPRLLKVGKLLMGFGGGTALPAALMGNEKAAWVMYILGGIGQIMVILYSKSDDLK